MWNVWVSGRRSVCNVHQKKKKGWNETLICMFVLRKRRHCRYIPTTAAVYRYLVLMRNRSSFCRSKSVATSLLWLKLMTRLCQESSLLSIRVPSLIRSSAEAMIKFDHSTLQWGRHIAVTVKFQISYLSIISALWSSLHHHMRPIHRFVCLCFVFTRCLKL